MQNAFIACKSKNLQNTHFSTAQTRANLGTRGENTPEREEKYEQTWGMKEGLHICWKNSGFEFHVVFDTIHRMFRILGLCGVTYFRFGVDATLFDDFSKIPRYFCIEKLKSSHCT